MLKAKSGAQIETAPVARSHQKRGVRHSVHVQYWSEEARSQVTWREYLCVISPIETPPQNQENGPGGSRTRICDLDRVLCCRYTTGPEWSLSVGAHDGKG